MASGADSLSEGIKDITECCICAETFKNPRILPCIHTFCYNCLEKTAEQFSWKSDEQVPCPLCRKEFILPVEGVSAIPKNFFMERLVEMTKISRPREYKLCDPCSDNDDPPLAGKFCLECQENLCENCATYHKKQKQSRNHRVVDIGNENMEELLKKSATTYCVQHKDKMIEMFCNDCNEAICMKCFAMSHQTHKFSEISNAAENYREELKGYISDIRYDDRREELTKIKADFVQDIANTETEINKAASELIDLVKKHRDTLLSELNSIKVKSLKNYEVQKDELDREFTVVENFKAYCAEMEAKGSDVDICRSINAIRVRFRELQNTPDSVGQQRITITSVRFKRTNAKSLTMNINNFVGTVFEWNAESKEDCRPSAPITVRTKQPMYESSLFLGRYNINQAKYTNYNIYLSMSCISSKTHNDRFYILYKDSNTIFSSLISNPFVVHEEIIIDELETPREMEISATSNCLYITDSGNNSIWKIEIEERRVSCWLTGLSEPYALSVTRDGRVVIPREGHPSAIEVRTPDATLVRTVHLSEEIQRPIQSVETPESGFAIIYYARDEKKIALCRVSESGTISHRFEPEDDKQKLCQGCHILAFAGKIDPWAFQPVEIDPDKNEPDEEVSCGKEELCKSESDENESNKIETDGSESEKSEKESNKIETDGSESEKSENESSKIETDGSESEKSESAKDEYEFFIYNSDNRGKPFGLFIESDLSYDRSFDSFD